MLGGIIYALLDISFNIILWTGKKTVNGVSYLYYYYKGEENETVELTKKEYEDIKNQIQNQTLLLEEIKNCRNTSDDK